MLAKEGEDSIEKLKLVQQISSEGVVAVLRGETPEEVVEMADQAIAAALKSSKSR